MSASVLAHICSFTILINASLFIVATKIKLSAQHCRCVRHTIRGHCPVIPNAEAFRLSPAQYKRLIRGANIRISESKNKIYFDFTEREYIRRSQITNKRPEYQIYLSITEWEQNVKFRIVDYFSYLYRTNRKPYHAKPFIAASHNCPRLIAVRLHDGKPAAQPLFKDGRQPMPAHRGSATNLQRHLSSHSTRSDGEDMIFFKGDDAIPLWDEAAPSAERSMSAVDIELCDSYIHVVIRKDKNGEPFCVTTHSSGDSDSGFGGSGNSGDNSGSGTGDGMFGGGFRRQQQQQ